MIITLIPLGDLELPAFLPGALKSRLGLPVRIGHPLPLPVGAYNPGRRQYDARKILRALEWLHREGKSLGVADVDLYVPGLNFVFGLAKAVGGDVGVIGLARLREEFYGRPPSEELFQARVLKEALHELGHLFGLTHCPNPFCVMAFSNTLADTDRKQADYCPVCRARLKDLLGQPELS